MSKEITNNFVGAEVEVVEGDTREFSVIYEDDPPALIYATNECDRLPTNNEITSRLVRTYGMDNLKTNTEKGL